MNITSCSHGESQALAIDCSIARILVERMHIHEALLLKHNITENDARKKLIHLVSELVKEDELIFKICYAIAIYAEHKPDYKIAILDFIKIGNVYSDLWLQGFYSPDNDVFVTFIDPAFLYKFKGIFTHEMTHQLMNVLYGNIAYPYELNSQREFTFDKVKEQIKENSKNSDDRMATGELVSDVFVEAKDILDRVFELYPEDHYNMEITVRYPEILALKLYEDEDVKSFYKPLVDYWNSYLIPDIDEFISNHELGLTLVSEGENNKPVDNVSNSVFDEDKAGVDFLMRSFEYLRPKEGSVDELKYYDLFASALSHDWNLCKELILHQAIFVQYPSIVGDFFYERGKKELSLEIDKRLFDFDEIHRLIVAKKWYERGEKDIAFEFDMRLFDRKDLVQQYTLGDKWYEMGEVAYALQFDKKLWEVYLDINYKRQLADKWYKRGRDIELEFDPQIIEELSEEDDGSRVLWDR